MATLVLTAVGSVFGPVGAAIGALAGQAVDARIFAPPGRQGPRLSDLRLQTSSFGTQIPALYGCMRVAGTVIWATDLIERSERQGGGKGQPSVTSFTYSANFAVALSSRAINHVGRIWADGNLLRGAAGDFKSGIGAFRVYEGAEDQPVDPLMAAAHGMDGSPAYRGCAYVVFEELHLADFGNRIPSLTFEIVADEADVPLSVVSGGLVGVGEAVRFDGEVEPVLSGYAASGATAGEALQPLLDGYDLLVRPDPEALCLTGGVAGGTLLRHAEDLRSANGETLGGREIERKPVEAVPRRLSVRHYDPGRDYQAGTQSAERQGPGGEEALIDLPATLSAAQARLRAADLLHRRRIGRSTLSLARGWSALVLRPGDIVTLDDRAGGWRIDALEWEGMAVRLALRGVPGSRPLLPPSTDGGAALMQVDRPVGPTHIALVELPQLADAPVDIPQLAVAACGDGRGWRGAAILIRQSDESFVPLGSMRRPSLLGRTLSILPHAPAGLFDSRSSVEVEVYDADAVPPSATDAAMIDGANACMIGEELVQFGRVTQTGPRRFRLSRLLRGRRGTEHRTAGHAIGESFVLIERDRLLALDEVPMPIGRTLRIVAQGIGDALPVQAERTVDGRAVVPLSPSHIRVRGGAASGFSMSWTRRSRLGWVWQSGADIPFAEETEAYAVEIRAGDVILRSDIVATSGWDYASDAIAADLVLAGGMPLTFGVRQVGIHGAGPAATADLSI